MAERKVIEILSTENPFGGSGAGISIGGRFDGTTATTSFANLKGIKESGVFGKTGGAFVIGTRIDGGDIIDRWAVSSFGHLNAATDNLYDIGDPTSPRPRTLRVGTSVIVGNTTITDGSVPVWVKITKTFTDFSAAALTSSINGYVLPAGGILHAVKVKHSASFTGGSISAYTVSVGISGNETKYAPVFDVFQATSATAYLLGSTLGGESHTATTNIVFQATSTGGNLDQASQGSVDIWLLVSVAA
jgi:hypothetical protein